MAHNSGSILPPEYDDIQPRDYDPAFTADISTKMRIPDKLAVVNGHGDPEGVVPGMASSITSMNVPEKIIVAGQEQHIGARPDVNLNPDFAPTGMPLDSYVGLSTPPRVLTMEQREFPTVDDTEELAREKRQMEYLHHQQGDAYMNGYASPSQYGNHELLDTLATPGDGLLIHDSDDDDIVTMRRQLMKLTRHVVHLEEENVRRNQRELILYPVMVGYFLFKIASWFLRSS